MTNHPPNKQPSQTPTDEGLRCPQCEYNLTGLVDDVCPECGEAFDRARLLERMEGAAGPIPEWSRRHKDGLVRAYISTLIEMWFFPLRFGRRFPANPELEGPKLFARICLGVALAISWLVFAFSSSGGLSSAVEFGVIGIAIVVGVVFCEVLMAGALFSPAEEEGSRGAAYDSGLALASMCRSYLVLNATVVSSYLVCLQVFTIPWNTDLASSFVLAGIALYWWLCMVLITTGHARRRTKILNTLIVTPFIAAFSFMVACLAAFVVGILLVGFRLW